MDLALESMPSVLGVVTVMRGKLRETPADRCPAFHRSQEEINAARNWSEETFRHHCWVY